MFHRLFGYSDAKDGSGQGRGVARDGECHGRGVASRGLYMKSVPRGCGRWLCIYAVCPTIVTEGARLGRMAGKGAEARWYAKETLPNAPMLRTGHGFRPMATEPAAKPALALTMMAAQSGLNRADGTASSRRPGSPLPHPPDHIKRLTWE